MYLFYKMRGTVQESEQVHHMFTATKSTASPQIKKKTSEKNTKKLQ